MAGNGRGGSTVFVSLYLKPSIIIAKKEGCNKYYDLPPLICTTLCTTKSEHNRPVPDILISYDSYIKWVSCPTVQKSNFVTHWFSLRDQAANLPI